MPTPADTITPLELVIAKRNKNDTETSISCNSSGVPNEKILFAIDLSILSLSFVRIKGIFLLLIINIERITLITCAITVAIAAPFAPIPMPFTKKRSPIMLNTEAMVTEMRGITESPTPLKTPLITL